MPNTKAPSIVIFRLDLRIEDNPALSAAVERGEQVIPLYIWDPQDEGEWAPGAASRWWLHFSLQSLAEELKEIGLKLIIRRGDAKSVINKVLEETGADAIFWNRRYEPLAIKRDRQIRNHFQQQGIYVESFNGSLLYDPLIIANKMGKPFKVFTPFWKACLTLEEPSQPIPMLKKSCSTPSLSTEAVESLELLPKIHWDAGIRRSWIPGAPEAKKILNQFIQNKIVNYVRDRDRPDQEGVSHLSPYLHFGEISPRMIWHSAKRSELSEGREGFLRQLGWREFAHHLLFHFPHTPDLPLREEFISFPWQEDRNLLKAWQQGKTGYPLVDAGMRELWTTGWMHNRVRMIVGSFLVKDLLISWVEGEKWFWDTLVDADLANNTLGWQWVGGCGADAAPYFRIFNPITQGEKFDPEGNYVRKWIPEIAQLSNEWIHQPWEAPENELRKAGISLGLNYPFPIVDHAEARKLALSAFDAIRKE